MENRYFPRCNSEIELAECIISSVHTLSLLLDENREQEMERIVNFLNFSRREIVSSGKTYSPIISCIILSHWDILPRQTTVLLLISNANLITKR